MKNGYGQDDTAGFCGADATPPMRDKAAHEWGTQIVGGPPAGKSYSWKIGHHIGYCNVD